MRRPLYTVDGDADAVEAFFDPSEYELDSVQVTALSDSRDKEWSAKFDLAREFAMTGGTFTVQAGAKGRWRDKSYDLRSEEHTSELQSLMRISYAVFCLQKKIN